MWGYYLYYLFMAGGDYPRLTEDAQRLLLFAGAVGILIYTLSLRLAVKKLKAVPTILLVISCLVIVYLFSMVTGSSMINWAPSGVFRAVMVP